MSDNSLFLNLPKKRKPKPEKVSSLSAAKPIVRPVKKQPVQRNQRLPGKVLEPKGTSEQGSDTSLLKANNITVLQLSKFEIEELKYPSLTPQTYRLSKNDIEWIKDTAYRLTKEVRKGKVSQGDLLRISIKLLQNALATNKKELITLLETIK